MNADLSLKLFDQTYEFINDRAKVKEFTYIYKGMRVYFAGVSKLEQTIDSKFQEKESGLAI